MSVNLYTLYELELLLYHGCNLSSGRTTRLHTNTIIFSEHTYIYNEYCVAELTFGQTMIARIRLQKTY